MDFLLEFVLELILETAMEGAKSSKIPKWVRFTLGSLILSFYFLIFGLIIYIAIVSWEENSNLSLFLLLISILLILFLVLDIKKTYKKIKNDRKDNL